VKTALMHYQIDHLKLVKLANKTIHLMIEVLVAKMVHLHPAIYLRNFLQHPRQTREVCARLKTIKNEKLNESKLWSIKLDTKLIEEI
jgi:hypothetical protein